MDQPTQTIKLTHLELLWITSWGAFRNWIKPSKINELTSLTSEIRGSYIKLPKFDLTTIATATNQFSPSQKIGYGESCTVYKAVLPTGQTVAVKRYSLNLSSHALEGLKNMIFLSSSFNHRNIMNPLGYCFHENGEAILVHDYMEQGTLFDHLHNKSRKSRLTWIQRLQICVHAAKGLDYLHTGFHVPIIHGDVKSANLLLDKKWMARVSNFYLSKALLSGERDTPVRSTMGRGALGYEDPQYYCTEKRDVYSYGVVLFEVLCGRRAISFSSVADPIYLASWATLSIEEGKLEEIVDYSLNGQIAPECLRIFFETAIACLNDQGSNRPAMRDVVKNLKLAMKLQLRSGSSFL